MKIVQSLWSKPGEKKAGQRFPDTNKCGWPHRKYNYISWALSCLQFKAFYDEIELVTDKAGNDLLVNKLGLPYTSVKIVLDDLNAYDTKMYAMGKIYAYSLQDKPFIHADGDVFIWERFSADFESSALLCQNLEGGIDYNRWYIGTFMEILDGFEYCPVVLEESLSRNEGIIAVNAGIIGGTDIEFFKCYTKESLRFIQSNTRHLSKTDAGMFNLIFEQFLFHAMSEQRGVEVTCYNAKFVRFWNDIADFTRIPSRTKYNHMMGELKKNRYVLDAMEYRLKKHHPEHYYRIIHLLHTNQI